MDAISLRMSSDLLPSAKTPVDIEGSRVAAALGLDVERFRQLMDNMKIDVLCERGTGEDTGKLRVTFYFSGKRARFLFDRQEWTVQA